MYIFYNFTEKAHAVYIKAFLKKLVKDKLFDLFFLEVLLYSYFFMILTVKKKDIYHPVQWTEIPHACKKMSFLLVSLYFQ